LLLQHLLEGKDHEATSQSQAGQANKDFLCWQIEHLEILMEVEKLRSHDCSVQTKKNRHQDQGH
jgi:hypothetical protein